MTKSFRFLFVIFLSGGALIAALAVSFKSSKFSPPGPLVEEKRFRDYDLRIYCRQDERFVERLCDKLPWRLSDFAYWVVGRQQWSGAEILKNGGRVFSAYGIALKIAEFGSNSVVGMDITGDGAPSIALSDRFGRLSGGSLWVFECGKKFRQIATVESLGTYPVLKDLDRDGIPELLASDDAFYHWPICRDGEPMPEVILRWRNGKYVAARDLMCKTAPAKERLEAAAAVIRSSREWDAESWWAPPELWTNVIALMYSGHENLGWEFLDRAWRPGFPGKQELIDRYLRSRLEQSAYWPDLKTQSLTIKLNCQ